MFPSARRQFVTSAKAAARPRRGGARDGAVDPLDIMTTVGKEFDFPLTRDTLLKLETRRQFLHYLRLEQFQFPDLVAFRKTFTKPSASQVIKVRHQHYQGEAHPADRKVSITFPVARLPLSSDAARHKLKLIAGPRWDSVRDEIKISCELFPTDKMNEKWCSDMVDRMIVEAEDTADTMADIPLDTRPTLARLKKKGKVVTLKDFPAEWVPPRGVEARSGSEGRIPVQDLPSAEVGSLGGAILGRADAPAP